MQAGWLPGLPLSARLALHKAEPFSLVPQLLLGEARKDRREQGWKKRSLPLESTKGPLNHRDEEPQPSFNLGKSLEP